MPGLVVVVPTRGRPESARRLNAVFHEAISASVVFVVDEDDPKLDEYRASIVSPGAILVAPPGVPGIVAPLNWSVNQILSDGNYDCVGFMGDDHLPHGDRWDIRIIETLRHMGTGIVYGNDLLQGEKLPTAAFMTSDIVQTLGYMAPPALHHLWVDNFWLDLGSHLGRLRYLDDVIIEHLHPLNGKSEWDPTYESANTTNASHDWLAYTAYKTSGNLDADILKIQAIL